MTSLTDKQGIAGKQGRFDTQEEKRGTLEKAMSKTFAFLKS